MKTKSDLQKIADKLFEGYPNAPECFVTSDGQPFLSKNRAGLHAGSKLRVFEFENSTIKDEKDSDELPTKAKEIVAFSKTASEEDAQSLLDIENKSDSPRTTVIEALEARIEKLKTEK